MGGTVIFVNESRPECLAHIEALNATEGRYVPKTMEDFLVIYGEVHSDEHEVAERARLTKGDGSDAVHWGLARYAMKWLNDRRVVKACLEQELADTDFERQTIAIENAWDIHDTRLRERREKERAAMGLVEPKPPRDKWFSLVPERFNGASMDDFPKAYDLFHHVASGGSLLLLGPTGVGKSRLLWAMASEIVKGGIDADVVKVTTLQELLAKVRTSGNEWTDEIIGRTDRYVWLFLDECDKVNGSENDYIVVSALVNHRYERGMGTVFAGNGTRDSIIAKLGEPVVSRLTAGNEKGKLFMVNGKDRRNMA